MVEVLTTQVGVSVGGHHLEHTVVNGQDGHIEGAATQVKHLSAYGRGWVHGVGQTLVGAARQINK